LRNLICFAMAALLFAAPATGLAGEEGGVAVGKGSLKVGNDRPGQGQVLRPD
jgi:hypothetical protein